MKEFFKKLFGKKGMGDKVIYANSTSKYLMTSDCTIEFSSKTNTKKDEINSKLKQLIKKYIDKPNKLIQYMRLNGLKIYLVNNMKKYLSLLELEEGFIIPQKGIKAFLLNIILSVISKNKLKFCFSTPEMIILEEKGLEIYTIARALHKYYGFKNNLPGFDEKSQKIFAKIYANKNKKSRLNNIPLKNIYACREALARDLESINFSLELSLENERAKKTLNKIISKQHTKI